MFKGYSEGIAKTILNGAGSKDNVIGILATDTDAWKKVANDKDYGPKLQQLYQKLVDSGNSLQLIDGLNKYAEIEMQNLKTVINVTPEK